MTAFYTQGITIDPRNASLVYAAGGGGLFKSSDRGESWAALVSRLTQSVAIDSQDSQTLYATIVGTISRSLDGGTTWQPFTTGLPAGSSGYIVSDPQVGGTVYTIWGGVVYKRDSSNGWVSRNSGLPAGFPSFITIDRNNSSILYTGVSIGLFKSTNGGASWIAASGGLTGVSPLGLAVDPFDSSHLLTWGNSSGYESKDGGANWAPFSNPGSRQAILLAFDPAKPGRIYNSATDGSGTFATVDRSDDGGKTWFSMQTGLGRAFREIFVVAPGGGTLYAGHSNGGVWVFHFARSRAVSH